MPTPAGLMSSESTTDIGKYSLPMPWKQAFLFFARFKIPTTSPGQENTRQFSRRAWYTVRIIHHYLPTRTELNSVINQYVEKSREHLAPSNREGRAGVTRLAE